MVQMKHGGVLRLPGEQSWHAGFGLLGAEGGGGLEQLPAFCPFSPFLSDPL